MKCYVNSNWELDVNITDPIIQGIATNKMHFFLPILSTRYWDIRQPGAAPNATKDATHEHCS